MMMFGLKFMDDVPFRTVYIHALVRDERGQKMSKSKGNVIDPLKLIDTYGADALRMTLTALAAQGRDIKMSEARVAGYRNFGTKLWNAARFCQMRGCVPVAGFDPAACQVMVNRWLVGKVVAAGRGASAAIEAFRFNEAAGVLYQFTWGTFCDWYLEFAKPILDGSDAAAGAETRATAAWALDQILHMLHPIMPFITEELYQALADRRGEQLILRPWPDLSETLVDATASAEIDWVVRLITLVRSIRAEMNVPAAAEIPLLLKEASDEAKARLAAYRDLIVTLARLSSAELLDHEVPKGSIQDVLDGVRVVLPIGDVIDISAEQSRLARELAKLDAEIDRLDRKLLNQGFLAKAPPEVVETERERRADNAEARNKLHDAVNRLSGLN
jgi:valyl-tRNA synthetase